MGDCFITRRGGGSGKLFAAIGVTYPAGSTCTCTNGSKTLKAKTTSGQCVFPIPEAGTWIVTATDGSGTASKTVEITAEGQTEKVTLEYYLTLFDNGEYHELTGGWTKISGSELVASWVCDSNLQADKVHVYAKTNNAIDVTNYKTLYAEITDKWAKNAYGVINQVYVGSATVSAEVGTVSIDISAMTGSYEIGLHSGGYWTGQANTGNASGSLNAVRIWLAP